MVPGGRLRRRECLLALKKFTPSRVDVVGEEYCR